MTDAKEATNKTSAMSLINTPFVTTGEGILCSGIYSGTGFSETKTPIISELDYQSFSIKFRFSIDAIPSSRIPVLVGGYLGRWIGLVIETTGKVSLLYNNSTYATGTSNCSVNTVHEGEIRYNGNTGVGEVLIDGVQSASATFTISTTGTKDITISNYSVGTTFKGIISHIRVYSRQV
jgi:hypothetical protein